MTGCEQLEWYNESAESGIGVIQKPWNGDPTEPLGAGPTENEDFPAAEQEREPDKIAEREED